MDEQERAKGQRASSSDGAGGCASQMRLASALDEGNNFAEGDLPQQITEQDEEKDCPEKGHEAIGMLLQSRAKYLDPKEFQDRFEEISRACWGVRMRLTK